MKKNISLIRKAGTLLMAAFLLTQTLASCSDNATQETTPLAATTLTAGGKTVSTLAFSWSPVEGASQYAYELFDADGKTVLGGVTTSTSVVATKLYANSEYTLKVWTYAAYGSDKSTSPIAELKAMTNDYTQLAKVQNAEATSGGGKVTVAWPAVEHADSYGYAIYNENGEEVLQNTVSTNSFTEELDFGKYTARIIAQSSDENYSQSEPYTLEFECVVGEKWRKTGTLTSQVLGTSCQAELVAYADGSYELVKPYGGDADCSIKFSVNASGEMVVSNVAADSYGYYNFWVSNVYYANIYTSGGYSSFEGDENSGEVWWGSYLYDADGNNLGWGYEDFTWDSANEKVDDIPSDCKEEVPQMLTTTWSQWNPYNTKTPTLEDGSHAATGCVATALAQIMNYYQYPAAYADGTAIDWDNMIASYDGTYTDDQAAAVATLMSKIGEAVGMSYGSTSTCYAENVETYLPDAFGYKVKYYGYRDWPNEQDATKWKSIIFHELSAGHPILYGGTSYKNGNDNYFSHAFIIDGYDKQGRVHVNYGFGGAGDAWVSIDKMPMTGITGWNDETFDTYQTLTVLHRPQDGDIDYDL